MTREKFFQLWTRAPFVPFRMHVKPGKVFDVPFAEVVRPLSDQVVVFIGMKQGTRQAKRFDSFPFEYIERIEERGARQASEGIIAAQLSGRQIEGYEDMTKRFVDAS